jgi:pilus assembly protein Flp/PilA
MRNTLLRFIREEEGVTAIEYGLIAALVALALLAGAGYLGNQLNASFNFIGSKMKTS